MNAFASQGWPIVGASANDDLEHFMGRADDWFGGQEKINAQARQFLEERDGVAECELHPTWFRQGSATLEEIHEGVRDLCENGLPVVRGWNAEDFIERLDRFYSELSHEHSAISVGVICS